MDRDTIEKYLERTILVLVLGALMFAVSAFGGVRASEFIVVEYLLAAIVVVWLVRIWVARKLRVFWPPVCWAVLPFVGYAAWRYRVADVELVAQQEFVRIFVGALLFLAFVTNVYTQGGTRLTALTLVFFAMAVAMYGIYQWLSGSDRVWLFHRPVVYHGRASGTFICPNHLAGFLEMVFPLAAALAISGRSRPLTRVFVAYACAAILVGIAATRSRGGWLAAAASTGMLVLFLIRNRRYRWAALSLFIVAAGVGSMFYSTLLQDRVTATYLRGPSKDTRLYYWDAAIGMWKTSPWFGVGPGHYDQRFRGFRQASDKTQARPGYTHNDYLNALADYGVVGLLLLLLPLVTVAWAAVRCWPYVQRGGDFSQQQSNRSALVIGSAAGLLAIAVHSFFDFNMHIPGNLLVAVILAALITTHLRFATERFWFTARWPTKIVVSLALAAGLAYLVPQTWVHTRELQALAAAGRQPEGSLEKSEALQRAFAIQPKNYETAYAIGEQLRLISWAGRDDYAVRARQAHEWFQRANQLNRWDVYSYMRSGMCLDWVDQHEEAGRYFAKALELDPNFYLTRAMMGWHEFQIDHYNEARDWMVKSLAVNFMDNPVARTYMGLLERPSASTFDRLAPK